jgi:arylsulfatase A-like enzyme
MSVQRAVLAGVLAALLASGGCQPRPKLPNIVLVVVDTARADHWSCYGYAQPTTPHIDAFAAEAIRFERAYSTSTWTLPAHASLFTGLYPATHQATQEHLQLDDRFETLAMLLQTRGYATAAFSGNPWVSRATHLNRGFDIMEEMWGRPEAREDGAFPHATNRLIFDWLRRRSLRQPFFLFVNYIEPHFPYDAPPAYEARFVAPEVSAAERAEATVRWADWYLHPRSLTPRVAALRAGLYDAELAYADAIVGELLAGLRQAGVYEDSLVVITSDHGENLGDHGHLDHVFSLYNSTLHVPLLIRRAGARQGGTVREDPVQLTDVFATIAAAAGAHSVHPSASGRDLLANVAPPERAIVAEYYYPAQVLAVFSADQQANPALDRFRRRLRSIQIGTRKLIWASDGREELYDLASDPGETHNLVAQQPHVAQELGDRLHTMLEQLQSGPAAPLTQLPAPTLDAATRERLRALGYVR